MRAPTGYRAPPVQVLRNSTQIVVETLCRLNPEQRWLLPGPRSSPTRRGAHCASAAKITPLGHSPTRAAIGRYSAAVILRIARTEHVCFSVRMYSVRTDFVFTSENPPYGKAYFYESLGSYVVKLTRLI